MEPELLELLASAAHEVWMDGKIRDGWVYAAETDKPNKKHACLVAYHLLSEADKQSDRDLVIGIPAILDRAGLVIAKKAGL